MQLGRALKPAEKAAALNAAKLPLSGQRAFARDFEPEIFEAWQGWVWGRQTFDLKLGTIDDGDALPAQVHRVCSLAAIEYVARKRDDDKIARRAVYRHEHDAPHATVVSTAVFPGAGRAMSSRGVGRFKGPAVFMLGRLYALEGKDENGDRLYWRVPSPGWFLVGCPVTHDMHVVRQGPARRYPPIWIVRGKSPYVLTDRGIDK